MELKTLSNYEALQASYKNPTRGKMEGKHCPLPYIRVAKAQAQHMLQQVVRWGELPCLHSEMVDAIMRRECPKCWQELRELASGL